MRGGVWTCTCTHARGFELEVQTSLDSSVSGSFRRPRL